MFVSLWRSFCLNKIHSSWNNFFKSKLEKKYLINLIQQLETEYNSCSCWPNKENVFRLFREIALDDIKVIILGQDPYHTSGVADGLAFSTQQINYIPPSLKNIFLEMSSDLCCSIPTNGDLLLWVKEGVFLLNTILSVRNGQALSHEHLWKEFTYTLINYLNDHSRNIVWVFWGQKARKIGKECSVNIERSIITSHPSFYSANNGFFSSRPFSRINQLLVKLNKKPINWTIIL